MANIRGWGKWNRCGGSQRGSRTLANRWILSRNGTSPRFVLFITLHSWERKQLFWSFLSMGLTSEFTYITEHLLSLFFFLILKWNMMSPALFKNIWHSLKIQMLFISRWHYACQCHITCSRNSFLQLCWKNFRHQHSIWECPRAGAHKLFSVRGQIISVLGFSGKSFRLSGPYAICQTSSPLSL